MWTVETCERCVVCEEVTPHTRRRIPLDDLAAMSLALLAVVCVTSMRAPVLAAVSGFAALWIGLRTRKRHLAGPCERCRGKARARELALRPDARNSTIDLL